MRIIHTNHNSEEGASIYISHRQGFRVGLNQKDEQILMDENHTVVLGKLTQRDVDDLCEYLQRLKIHLAP